jgi:hypothetical protein
MLADKYQFSIGFLRIGSVLSVSAYCAWVTTILLYAFHIISQTTLFWIAFASLVGKYLELREIKVLNSFHHV